MALVIRTTLAYVDENVLTLLATGAEQRLFFCGAIGVSKARTFDDLHHYWDSAVEDAARYGSKLYRVITKPKKPKVGVEFSSSGAFPLCFPRPPRWPGTAPGSCNPHSSELFRVLIANMDTACMQKHSQAFAGLVQSADLI